MGIKSDWDDRVENIPESTDDDDDDCPIACDDPIPISESSDSSSARSPGITIILSICFHFHVECGRVEPVVVFGNALTQVCATSALYVE